MRIRSLLLCVPGLLLACRHGPSQTEPDASSDSSDGNPPDGSPPPRGTCSGLAAGLTCSTPYCAADYELTDLGAMGAGNASTATAIDDAGNVAGTFHPALPDARVHAFRWSARDGFVDLGTLGGDSSQGLGVSGERVVGGSDVSSGRSHAFVSDAGGLHDLGTLGGADSSIARSINAAGVAVGESLVVASGVTRATRFEDGMPGALPMLADTPGSTSAAFAINASGVIVGRSGTASGKSHAAMWASGTVVDLDTLDSAFSIATAINAQGDAVGAAGGLPVRFTGGRVLRLGIPSGFNNATATGINDAGVIVGNSRIVTAEGSGDGPGFVYDGAVATDLAELLVGPPASNGRINQANAINHAGQIAAAGSVGGHVGALILTPHCTSAPPFRSLAVATGPSVAPPEDVTAGDLLLVALRYDGDPVVVTPPDGWTLVADRLAGAGTEQVFHALVYVHVAAATEPASYTFAAPDGVPVHSQLAAYPYLSTVDDVTAASGIGTTISTQGDVTTTRDGAVLIGIFMGPDGASWTRASGQLGRMTLRSSIDGISLQDEWRPTAGPSGLRGSRTSVVAPLAAILVALR